MHCRFRKLEEGEGPFPGEDEDAEEEVDDLEDGEGFDGAVEIGGEEVPEDLWPEEPFERGGDLVYGFCELLYLIKEMEGKNLQTAAVRTMRRAQWFLMSLPICLSLGSREVMKM